MVVNDLNDRTKQLPKYDLKGYSFMKYQVSTKSNLAPQDQGQADWATQEGWADEGGEADWPTEGEEAAPTSVTKG